MRGSWYLLGDVSKGGRLATEEERRALCGTTEQGIPRGLSQCPVCGEWKGQCLDTIPSGKIIVTVSCHCENTNRCAACFDQLAKRKLNANYFDVTDGKIWHVPGFVACSHQCKGGAAPAARPVKEGNER
jgi:hypothetical protein